MSSLKISQLTATTSNTIGSWVVINNSGETTTNKSQLEDVLGLTIGAGANSMRSADLLATSGGTASGESAIALGNGASALDAQSIAIGKQAYAARERDIAIGFGANTDLTESQDGIAIGTGARVVRDYGIALGYDAIALTDGIAIGRSTRPIGDTCIAIGASNVAAGNRGYVIGYGMFADRDDAGAIGASMYVDGARSVAVGANGTIGQSGGSCEDSVNIGSTNTIAGGGSKQISIGYSATTSATGAINISSGGLGVNSPFAINIGGSGNTYGGGVSFGNGNIRIGGFNDTIDFTPGSNNIWLGGLENTINSGGSSGVNNVYLGLSGRTYTTIGDNRTYVENLTVYGGIRQISQQYTTSGAVVIDISTVGYVEIETQSGQTYDLQISPSPNSIGDAITLFIQYRDGATITFNNAGNVQWRWGNGAGTPVFSATTGNVSRSIIVLNSWDGNDVWEVSRSMNME